MAESPWFERMKKSFADLDTDNDGFIIESELARLGDVVNEELSQDELKRMMGLLDANEDGKIDFDEFRRVTVDYFQETEE